MEDDYQSGDRLLEMGNDRARTTRHATKSQLGHHAFFYVKPENNTRII